MNEIIGKIFGDLTVTELHYENNELNYRKYICKCKCGKEIIADEIDLLNGNIVNCGCKYLQEYFLLKCNCCGNKIEVPFNKSNLSKIENEWIDKDGKQHYDIIYRIDYTCDKCEFENKIQNDNFLSSKNVQLLKKFVNENCIVGNYFPLKERITRKDFKLAYNNWLGKNGVFDKRLPNNKFNIALKKLYDETFIKSNGIFYMTKVKLKD